MLDLNTLGKKIKEMRNERKITQSDFAEILGVTYQAVSNWERGIAPPDLENLINIANYFGVLVDDLLNERDEKLFLGIDGGGTKTEFVITTEDGHILDKFVRSGSNPNDIGVQNAFTVLCDGIKDALIKFPRISYAFLGIAGVSVADNAIRLANMLKDRYPTLVLQLKTDSANLFGIDDCYDLVVISGTGSVVFVKTNDTYVRLGGWGYLFDNAGSAYDIGRDAIRAALTEEDLRKNPSVLTCLLKKKLGTPTVFDAIKKLNDSGKAYIASLASTVFEAYNKGDEMASAIIENTARRLGELLDLGAKIYGTKKKALAGGGMFEHYSNVILPMIAKYTDVQIKVCDTPPVYGACRSSIRLCGMEIPDSFEENFRKGYGVI